MSTLLSWFFNIFLIHCRNFEVKHWRVARFLYWCNYWSKLKLMAICCSAVADWGRVLVILRYGKLCL